MIIASWSGLLGNSWPKQLKLVTVGTIGDHCVCQRVALDWGKVFEMPWLVTAIIKLTCLGIVHLAGHIELVPELWVLPKKIVVEGFAKCLGVCCLWRKLAKIDKKTCLWFSRSGAQAFKVETVTLLRPISAVYYLATTWSDDSMSDLFFPLEFMYNYVMICIWSKTNWFMDLKSSLESFMFHRF